jgi:hypothetical protein
MKLGGRIISLAVVASCTFAIFDGCSNKSSGTSATSVTIGASGGSVHADAVTIDVPAGALSSDQQITVTKDSDTAPSGFSGFSPVYRFGPDGILFNTPITVTITFDVPATKSGVAQMYWTVQGGTTFEEVGLPTGVLVGKVSAQVTHFSQGFVGVSRDEHPDASSSSSPDATTSTGDGATGADAAGEASGSCGSCTAAETCCNGTCADTSSDPHNCGKCGFVCTSNLCNAGQCAAGG